MTVERSRSRALRGRSELITILWRDIPAQVTARSGRNKKAVELPGRFQTAIDRAAMVADKQTYDQYIGEWRRTARACGEDVEAEATAEAARLDREYPLERLARMAAGGGFHPGSEERAGRTGNEERE